MAKVSQPAIHIKRVYETPARADGKRVLVDRLWPRGLSKEAARIDIWMKDIAPSGELRKWFGHLPERWPEFQRRYEKELAGQDGLCTELLELARAGKTTLLFGAKDEERNQAVVLLRVLEKRL